MASEETPVRDFLSFFFRWLCTLLKMADTIHCNCSIVFVSMQQVSLHKAKRPNFSLEELLTLCNKTGLRKNYYIAN